jgi:hypothetical protein
MNLRKKTPPSAAAQLFIKTAQQYLGYTSDLGGRNMFGQKVGYDSAPWAGAFIDVVAREAGLKNVPSFTYTPAAMAECIRAGNFSRVPRPGSIAVFNFPSKVSSSSDAFNSPHCGIVTNTKEFLTTGRFVTVEGNTEGSTAYTKKDGVHQKIRSINDVVFFFDPAAGGDHKTFNERLMAWMDGGRTKFDGEDIAAIDAAARVPLTIKLSAEIKHGDRNKKIETIQLALATVTDLRGAEPGKWDQITSAACSRFQRNVGRTGSDVTGLPDLLTLQRLSKDTGLFSV